METRRPEFWAATVITYAAALIAYILRLIARRLKGVPFNWGDFLALVSFLFTTAYTIANLYKIHTGLGLHLPDLGLEYDVASFNIVAYDYFRLLWVDMWLYTFAIGLSKLTALALYWRIFGQSTIRNPILVLMGCVTAWMIARIIVIPLICTPITKFWHLEQDGHCNIQTSNFFYGSTVPHLLMEVVIVVLPCIQVRKLNLPKAQKIAVGAMFASGTLVCIASLVQLVQAIQLDTSSLDLWWTATPQTISAVIEINLGHFSTSLPNLRPILDIVTGRKSIADTRRTPYYGHTTDRSGIPRKPGGIFSQHSRLPDRNDSEVELAQYGGLVLGSNGRVMPGEIWKSTTTDVQSAKRDST